MKREELQVSWDPKTGEVAGEKLGQPVTLQELVEAVGLTMEEVELEGNVESTAWPTSMKLEKRGEDGRIQKSVPIQVWNHRAKAKLRVLWDEVASRKWRDKLLEDVRAEAGRLKDPVPPKQHDEEDSVLVELDIFDPHFQLLAWGPESGQNHDLDIIAAKVRAAVVDLVDQALATGRPIHRWLLPIGNDLFHTDQYIQGKGGATARGTPQDVDTRRQKAARVVRYLLTDIVTDLLEHAPVDVLVVPGNHDRESAWWMGEILDARFHNNPNVEVDNRPILRKYYPFGNALIGFTHGSDEQHAGLRDLMSQEARVDWANSVFREWHVGHEHHEWVNDVRGIVLRKLPSLAGTDAWHYGNGLVHAQRGARGFVWTRDRGVRTILCHNIPVTPQELEYTAPLLRGDR